MSNQIGEAAFADRFAELMDEGRGIYDSYSIVGGPPTGLQDRVKDWIRKAQALAKDVNADSFSVTGGFPWGLSVTVGFRRSDEII